MKKALVLSGGGYKGIFQAGVLMNGTWDYDAVFGTSVGALNGMLVAQDDISAMHKFWNDVMDGRRFHKTNIWLTLRLLLDRVGLYQTTIQKDLEAQLGTFKKEYYCTATDIKNQNGDLYYFGIQNAPSKEPNRYDVKLYNDSFEFITSFLSCDREQISKLITASTLIPGIFEPMIINNWVLVDGGIRNVTPLAAAVKWGADDITIIDCSPSQIPAAGKLDRIDRIIMRSIDVMVTEINKNDTQVFLDINKMVRKNKEENDYDTLTLYDENVNVIKDFREIGIRIYRPKALLMKDSTAPTKLELVNAFNEGLNAKPLDV